MIMILVSSFGFLHLENLSTPYEGMNLLCILDFIFFIIFFVFFGYFFCRVCCMSRVWIKLKIHNIKTKGYIDKKITRLVMFKPHKVALTSPLPLMA